MPRRSAEPIPQGLERITYKAEEHIKSISNVSDNMQGNDREDVAAKAIQFKQARGSVNFSKVLDNLERTDWILARWVLDAWQQYYTEPRIITVTHQLGQDPQTVQLNQVVDDKVLNDLTVGEYSIKVVSAPYRALLEDSQFEQAMKLREAGVQIPDSVLIENSRLTNKAGLIKQLAAASETPEAKEEQQLKMRAQRAAVSSAEADTLVKTTKAKKEVAQAEKLDRGRRRRGAGRPRVRAREGEARPGARAQGGADGPRIRAQGAAAGGRARTQEEGTGRRSHGSPRGNRDAPGPRTAATRRTLTEERSDVPDDAAVAVPVHGAHRGRRRRSAG
jgi:hypothetical protein